MPSGTKIITLDPNGNTVDKQFRQPESIKIEIYGKLIDLDDLLEAHTPGCSQ